MPIRVTSPKPIASRPSAALPKMRASQISPAPPAMPTRAVRSPAQCNPPRSPNGSDRRRSDRGHRQNAVRLPAADESGQGEPHRPPPAVPTVPGAGQERGAPTQKAAQGDKERKAAGKAFQPRRPRVWGGQAKEIERRRLRSVAIWASGRSDQGTAVASNRPSSVPGRVIASGMVFSSMSISEAANISEINARCERKLRVQEKRHEAASGKPCGQESLGDVFPPVKCGEAESEAQFDEHGPDPEAGAVQEGLAPQAEPAEDRHTVPRPPRRRAVVGRRPGADRSGPPREPIRGEIDQSADARPEDERNGQAGFDRDVQNHVHGAFSSRQSKPSRARISVANCSGVLPSVSTSRCAASR